MLVKLMADKSEKPVADRIKECITIISKLTNSLKLPKNSPEIKELREHMNTYIKTGEGWTGEVQFLRWNRIAHCKFPKYAINHVEVTLKHIPIEK